MRDFLIGLSVLIVFILICLGIGHIGIPNYDIFHKTVYGLIGVIAVGCVWCLCWSLGGISRLLIKGEDNA